MNIIIDGKSVSSNSNMCFRGLGMVSGNNSSRLLMDYKYEHPDKYWELMNIIFGEKGLGITHLKLEMGSDVNSSSGTEPCIKRSSDEIANIRKGMGFQLASDAKSINPSLTLDMLWWSEPAWISASSDVYSARYSWFRETLISAYYVYSIKFDYISASRNERTIDTAWIKYLSKKLKKDTGVPYDFSKIKIVAADEDAKWDIADLMMKDKALKKAVDVIGSHYTSWTTKNVRHLQAQDNKEVWFTEGSPPMAYEQGLHNIKSRKDTLSYMNGILDIAMRIINMYALGKMTMYEFQPLIASYYDGVTYCQKQLIKATTPWNGYYELDSGYYMALHFSLFIKKGWEFIDSSCFGSGRPGGDGHSVTDADFGYITATNKDTGDYSIVIVNNTKEEELFDINTVNMSGSGRKVYIWETARSDNKDWQTNMFRRTDVISPDEVNDGHSFKVSIRAYSLVTISTVDVKEDTVVRGGMAENKPLTLPYSDDFSYSSYQYAYLLGRGNAPRYMTDKGGAFEVRKIKGQQMLMQLITKDMKPEEWGTTPEPTTDFGDDRWLNYSVAVDAIFDSKSNDTDIYVGAGLRYSLGDSGRNGYIILLYSDGRWELLKNDIVKYSGTITLPDNTVNLRIEAYWNTIRAYVNDTELCEYLVIGESLLGAGRAALFSSYHNNAFRNVVIRPTGMLDTYVRRLDNTHSSVSYTGKWEHETMSTFRNYMRTISHGNKGSVVSISYYGGGIFLSGANDHETSIKIEIDGETIEENYVVPKSGNKECFYDNRCIKNGRHMMKITVLEGRLSFDYYETVWKEGTLTCHIQET